MGPIQSVEEFLSLLRRRRLLIAAVVLFGAIVSFMVGVTRPKTYETGAVIQVESPVIDGQEQNAGAQSARVLQVIEQRLTTRENLAAMIERHGLFGGEAAALPLDKQIAALRASITFQSIASAAQQNFGAPTTVSALMITTRLDDPEKAARVANDLAQSVLDMSVARQTSRAMDTVRFFQAEEARVSQEIVALEAEIAVFKNANPVAQAGSDAATDRAALDSDLRRLSQDILAVQGERGALEGKDRLRETDRRRIDELKVQEGVLQSQQVALQAQRAALDQRAAQAPEVERRLSAYARQLQQLQSQYDLVSARKAEAETALRLEEENHAEHFSLLERAIAPASPTGGGGRKIALAGAVGSLIFGIVLAFLLDLLNPVLRSARQMERELDIRPVITLPVLNLHPATSEPWVTRLWHRLRGRQLRRS
ncbi:uncharacterized protein involved in exopolysaccharide biosynthesis [Gemmobacter caeni]|jgi:uncharacterized protein involved in exopolysaccharide biosynthesis|uniref:Uncharacterized protein involved in exopolysaccharide biosynthesis n=2 Tax=Gemmobacter TaxID=204456 RepID=A0A2T6AVQ6_9RHOB|nr:MULTISPECIES: Wzz/FepE/Etk N-terminal domain-containing protein [Gemmobacter]OJY34188.1 MAG: hypothetical protein BGP11_03700 [Rhodobacterales bacterium 65-51]PTX47898.1 uncharacterized protein involved in exopolysaccharide biosynthesis [Gemmobacter caeni]TWI97380.1 uncharacterized protein involved in exopolysaccharide biosynthesis [Gemmobacter caeni]GHC30939.1 hypothetical protein GCM10007291_34620 [Gemmobacter nanjingensis]